MISAVHSVLRTHQPLPKLSATCKFAASAMGDAAPSDKQAARRAVQAALRSLDEAAMAEESAAVAAHVLAANLLPRAGNVAIYVHCARLREVDTGPVLRSALEGGSRVFVPRVQDKESNMHFLHINGTHELQEVPPYGILEPQASYADGRPREDALECGQQLTLVVIPGLAFDVQGRRLGRGGGYYDSFIERCRRRAAERGWEPPLLVALAYRTQVLERVPVAGHDEHMDVMVTADGVIKCSPRAHAMNWTS